MKIEIACIFLLFSIALRGNTSFSFVFGEATVNYISSIYFMTKTLRAIWLVLDQRSGFPIQRPRASVWIIVNNQCVRRTGSAKQRISSCTVLLSVFFFFFQNTPYTKIPINLKRSVFTAISSFSLDAGIDIAIVRSTQQGLGLIFPIQTSLSVNK